MPNPFLLSVLAASTTPTTTASKAAGGSSAFLFVIIGLFAVVYFVVLRPKQRKLRQQAATGPSNLAIGDEIITAGGILGTILAIAGDEIVVEVGPGSTLTFWRRAVNLRTAVKGAPQSAGFGGGPGGPDDGSYAGDSYAGDSYAGDSYAGDSYVTDSYSASGDSVPDATDPEAPEAESDDSRSAEGDHRDVGGPGEGI